MKLRDRAIYKFQGKGQQQENYLGMIRHVHNCSGKVSVASAVARALKAVAAVLLSPGLF